MQFNILAILAATVAQFIVGAFWYTFLFGKQWGKIHGFDKLSKKVQDEMVSKMGPIYGAQFVVTLVASFVFSIFVTMLPTWNPYGLAFFFWLGFTVPAQAGAAFFGGTEPKWMVQKIAIQAFGALASLLAAAAVLSAMI